MKFKLSAVMQGMLAACVVLSNHTIANESSESEVEKIQVTGSRIARTSAQMTTPTTMIDAKAIALSGVKNIGDLLHKLPAMVDGTGSTTGKGAGGNLASAGQELINLRGLGTERSLVLVNGRRHVSGDAGNSAVDVSMIPSALIERVEIITGGASAIYGADAVTGVVNFIMKKNFTGFEVDTSLAQSAEGDAKNKDFALTYGTDFDGGNGNVTLHLNYSDREALPITARDYANKNHSFIPNPLNTGPEDGIADTVFVDDLRFQALSAEGLIYLPNDQYFFVGQPISKIPVPTFANDPIRFPFGFVGYDTYTIDRGDGRFRPFQGGDFCDGPVTCSNGDGFRTSETNYAIVPSERILFNLGSRYDVNDKLTLYVDAKYGKVESFAIGQASIFHDDNFGPLISLKQDNPFIPNELRDLMQERNVQDAALAVVGLPSSSENLRKTMQLTFGGEGQLKDYDYEFYVQHGRVNADLYSLTTFNEKYYRALDATTDENGNAICRDTSDPACVPYNPIFKQASAEALAYAGVKLHTEQEMDQTVANFSLSGDLAETDTGVIAFAAGLEYRSESSLFDPDELTKGRDENGVGLGLVGVTTGQTPATNSFLSKVEGSYNVKEVFAEVSVPLLSDLPLIESFDVELAARYSKHSITGGDSTYKASFNWQLGYDIGSRVSFSRAVRAPNIQELFAPASSEGARLVDPCHKDNLDAEPAVAQARRANCAKLGLGPDFTSNASFGTVLTHTEGNKDLTPETADTLTVGFTYSPNVDFNVSIDYWDIEISDAITPVSGTDILSNCVDGSQLDTSFCDKIKRADNGNILFVRVNSVNAALFSARGVDLETSYGFDADYGRLDFRLNATYLDERKTDQNPKAGLPVENDAGSLLLSRPYPRVRANLSTTYRYENVIASLNSNFIGNSQFDKRRSDEYYPKEFGNRVGSYISHNLQINYEFDEALMVYLGVNNLTDKRPPMLPGLNQGTLLYDVIGRNYRLGLNYQF
jgi:outer membrane receptor protein involved in Fe transport